MLNILHLDKMLFCVIIAKTRGLMKIEEAKKYMKLEDNKKLPIPSTVPEDETDRQIGRAHV